MTALTAAASLPSMPLELKPADYCFTSIPNFPAPFDVT